MLQRILDEGVDVVRLNLSHGAPEDHERRAREARAAAAALGREVAVLADLQGPKIRIAKFAAGPVLLEPGATVCARMPRRSAAGRRHSRRRQLSEFV